MTPFSLVVPDAVGTISSALDLGSLNIVSPLAIQLEGAAQSDGVNIYESNLATITELAQASKILSVPALPVAQGGDGRLPAEAGGTRQRYLYAERTQGTTTGLTLRVMGSTFEGAPGAPGPTGPVGPPGAQVLASARVTTDIDTSSAPFPAFLVLPAFVGPSTGQVRVDISATISQNNAGLYKFGIEVNSVVVALGGNTVSNLNTPVSFAMSRIVPVVVGGSVTVRILWAGVTGGTLVCNAATNQYMFGEAIVTQA